MNTILESLTTGRTMPLPWTVASLLAGLVGALMLGLGD
jgi:hypothetical protein